MRLSVLLLNPGLGSRAAWVAAFLLLTSCTGNISGSGELPPTDMNGLPNVPSTPGGSGADSGVRDTAGMGLPCAVVNLLNSRCTGCHSDPTRAGALMPMLSLDDLRAPTPTDPLVRVIDQAVVRMIDGRMPPPPLPAATESEVAAVLRWVDAGLSATNCDPSDPDFVDPKPVAFEGSGAEVFAAVCASCHGSAGEGTDKGYELQHPVRGYGRFVVRTGRPGLEFFMSEMSAYEASLLTAQQLEEIWDLLSGVPQPTSGEGLFVDYCANCHGTRGSGGVVDQDLDEETFEDLLENVREGNGDNDYAARDMYMPSWTNAELSDAEVRLIADYLGLP